MMKKGIMLASVLILSIGFAFATSNPSAITETENELRTTITGTVADANTEAAIEGAEVTISETRTSATTDASGTFSFAELEAGSYTLSVSADGYETAETRVEVTEEGANVQVELHPQE
jgi:hypothetical protein